VPRFTIIPTNPAVAAVDVIAGDAAAVLHRVDRLGISSADVLRNDSYAFSLAATEGGFWTIFQRAASTRAAALSRSAENLEANLRRAH
jgi:hypothetical protein